MKKIDADALLEKLGMLGVSNAYDRPSFWYGKDKKDYKVIPTKYHNGYDNALADVEKAIQEMPTIEERKTMTHEEAAGFLQESGWLQDHDKQIYEQGKRDGIEEHKTDTCENVGEDYAEVDQFVCSKCGIELQDWNSVERCEDGEVIYHEYTFRFCPHCGRKIVEGAIVSRMVNEEKDCDIAFKIIKKEEG